MLTFEEKLSELVAEQKEFPCGSAHNCGHCRWSGGGCYREVTYCFFWDEWVMRALKHHSCGLFEHKSYSQRQRCEALLKKV